MLSLLSHPTQHNLLRGDTTDGGLSLPTAIINQENSPTDMHTSQSDGSNSSVERPSYQMSLVGVTLKKTLIGTHVSLESFTYEEQTGGLLKWHNFLWLYSQQMMQCISEQICDLPIDDIYHVGHPMCPCPIGPCTAELLPSHTVQMNCMLRKPVGKSNRKVTIFQGL